MAITSRVYPRVAVDNLANLYLFNNGTTPVTVRSVDVYALQMQGFRVPNVDYLQNFNPVAIL